MRRRDPMSDVSAQLDAFCDTLRGRTPCSSAGAALTVSRAPGRLDVMGGIADYSGSLVLQRPIAEATFAAVQRHRSSGAGDRQPRPAAVHDSARGAGAGRCADQLRRARRMFADECGLVAPHWVSYVAGVFLVLARERGMPLTSGARLVVVVASARGQGRELLGRHRNREHACGGDRLRDCARASRPRAAVPEERESRHRRAVRCDGSDDVRLRRTRTRCWRSSVSQPNCSRPFQSRTTSSSGGSIPASVTPWAGPTTAPCGRARSWVCEFSTERAGAPVDYLANIAPRGFRAGARSPSSRRDLRATTSSHDTAARRDTVTTVERGQAISRAGSGGSPRLRAPAGGAVSGSCCAPRPTRIDAFGSVS